jgi:DNA mismatch endonuclease (patch repair protein)
VAGDISSTAPLGPSASRPAQAGGVDRAYTQWKPFLQVFEIVSSLEQRSLLPLRELTFAMRTRIDTTRFENVPDDRRAIMAKVRRKNTEPELKVRSILHRLGFRYVLHDERLPGKPDLVFPSRRVAIFVHGCFWHRHSGCNRARLPVTRRDYWKQKFRRNVKRDRRALKELEEMGWRVLVIWECEVASPKWVRVAKRTLARRSFRR